MPQLVGRITLEPTGEFRPPAFRDWFLTNETDPKPLCAGSDWVGERRHILRVVSNTLREAPEPRKLTFGEACKLAVERPGVWVASRAGGDEAAEWKMMHDGTRLWFSRHERPGRSSDVSTDDILAEWTEIVKEPVAAIAGHIYAHPEVAAAMLGKATAGVKFSAPDPDYMIFEKVPGGCVKGEPCMFPDGWVFPSVGRNYLAESGYARLRVVRKFNEVPNAT